MAGLGWNTNASGMLNGSYWGMQTAYDAHVVQVQLPMDSRAELVWGAPPAFQPAVGHAFGCAAAGMVWPGALPGKGAVHARRTCALAMLLHEARNT